MFKINSDYIKMFNNLAHMGARSRFGRITGEVIAAADEVDGTGDFEISTISSCLFFKSQLLMVAIINKNNKHTKIVHS